MPTSPLYLTISQQLTNHLEHTLPSQVRTLALVVIGFTQSVTAQLGRIARTTPLETT